MCIVSDGHFVLLLDIAEEWTLVVYSEGENAVLVGNGEVGAVNGAIGCSRKGLQIETIEGREHREFELYGIVDRSLERCPVVVHILGQFNGEDLILCQH